MIKLIRIHYFWKYFYLFLILKLETNELKNNYTPNKGKSTGSNTLSTNPD